MHKYLPKIVSFYGVYLPYHLSELSWKNDYDPDSYFAALTRVRFVSRPPKWLGKKTDLLQKTYVYLGYYFWLLYVASCLYVSTFRPLGALVGFLVIPLVTAGFYYSLNYGVSFFKNTKSK